MADDGFQTGSRPALEDSGTLEREIEALMRQPLKPPPSIIVIGDEHVFGITPARS